MYADTYDHMCVCLHIRVREHMHVRIQVLVPIVKRHTKKYQYEGGYEHQIKWAP
jgi:hypothetical protein